MATLIDGYNLLYAVGILGRHVGPGTLERARQALLGFLAASLSESERADTTVVFDAKSHPPGVPRELNYRGIRVLFAVGHADADDLLQQLIRADSSPRRLVVVSSDHQLHRAARRRRATAIDSDCWYDELRRHRRARQQPGLPAEERPAPEPGAEDAAYWLDVFSRPEAAAGSETPRASSGASLPQAGRADDDFDVYHPFPPGYAEDLLADEERGGG